jgi:hypothetical protein
MMRLARPKAIQDLVRLVAIAASPGDVRPQVREPEVVLAPPERFEPSSAGARLREPAGDRVLEA